LEFKISIFRRKGSILGQDFDFDAVFYEVQNSGKLHSNLKFRNLEIGEHSSFSIIEQNILATL